MESMISVYGSMTLGRGDRLVARVGAWPTASVAKYRFTVRQSWPVSRAMTMSRSLWEFGDGPTSVQAT